MEHRYDALCFDLFGTLTDDRGRAMDGALDLLTGVRDARWAIVTSAPRALAEAILAAAGLPLPAVLVTGDDVERSKPDPACYAKAIAHLGVVPERALAIEDSVQGLAAARGAGLDTIAILRGARIGSVRDAVFAVERIADVQLRSATDGGAILRWGD